MGVEYNQPAHLLDRYIKGGDINGGRLYSTANSGSFSNAHEVMKRFDLDPGKYYILPCAFKPNEEGDFLLCIFTESFSSE